MVDLLEIGLVAISSVSTGVAVFLIQRIITERNASDRDILWRCQEVFGRPAFRGRVGWYTDWGIFAEGIDTVIKEISAGSNPGGQGPGGKQVPGFNYLKNKKWRLKMFEVAGPLE